MRFLGLCGSLRAASRNRALLNAAARAVPAGATLSLYECLRDLPPFDPDLDKTGRPLPAPVAAFAAEVEAASALVIACPEYAHGIPGTFKNALDWLVGRESFPGTPVALLDASGRSSHVGEQLREVLTTMSAVIIEAACVTIPIRAADADLPRIVLPRSDLAILRRALSSLREAADGRAGPV